MTEFQKAFFMGFGAGALVALIFMGYWFKFKIDDCKEAGELIFKNYSVFMEKRIQHEAAQGYAKGLAHARMCVNYFIRRLPAEEDAQRDLDILNDVAKRIGEKMQPAEDELELRHAILKGHKHEV